MTSVGDYSLTSVGSRGAFLLIALQNREKQCCRMLPHGLRGESIAADRSVQTRTPLLPKYVDEIRPHDIRASSGVDGSTMHGDG